MLRKQGFRVRGASCPLHLTQGDYTLKEQSIVKSNKNNSEKATVSVRNMDMNGWHKAGYKCKVNGVTLSQYVEALIKLDLKEGLLEFE